MIEQLSLEAKRRGEFSEGSGRVAVLAEGNPGIVPYRAGNSRVREEIGVHGLVEIPFHDPPTHDMSNGTDFAKPLRSEQIGKTAALAELS
jgi:hypothetical protein